MNIVQGAGLFLSLLVLASWDFVHGFDHIINILSRILFWASFIAMIVFIVFAKRGIHRKISLLTGIRNLLLWCTGIFALIGFVEDSGCRICYESVFRPLSEIRYRAGFLIGAITTALLIVLVYIALKEEILRKEEKATLQNP